jgi:hypothetical protein
VDLPSEFFQRFPPLAHVGLGFFLILVVSMICKRISLPAVVGLRTVGVVADP